MNDKKNNSEPITSTILRIIGDARPDWFVGPLDEVEKLAKEHGIDIKDLNITPLVVPDEE